MKLFKMPLILLLAITLFTGCNTYTDEGMEINRTNENFSRGARIQNVNEEQRFNSYNQSYRMRVADEVQDQVVQLTEVQSANVIVVNRNAYVAVVLENGDTDHIRKDIEKKISDQVKATDETITNVYVSTNPDFVVRMTDYGEKLQSGRPVTGLTEEFNETIERVFPIAR